MATKLSQFRTDTKKESEGVWVRYYNTDVEFLIARFGNPLMEAELRDNKSLRKLQLGVSRLTDSEARKVSAPVLAKRILLNWKNLQDDTGMDMEYSVAQATTMLADDTLHDFYEWVVTQSKNQEHFKQQLEDENLGN